MSEPFVRALKELGDIVGIAYLAPDADGVCVLKISGIKIYLGADDDKGDILMTADVGTVAMPLWSLAPFALLLGAIAILPLVANHFWESNRNKAIVAIARKLLVAIWHVLTARVADRHAKPDKVALKMMTWAWKIGAEQRGGLTPGQFVRQELTRLRLGAEMEQVTQSGRRLRIPPAAGPPALATP